MCSPVLMTKHSNFIRKVDEKVFQEFRALSIATEKSFSREKFAGEDEKDK
jgi:hypothetical protein